MDPGKLEFEANYAACHGLSGKGDGSVVPALKNKPTDLTQLAKKNGGVPPVPQLVETIRGTKRIDAHGTTDMPAWGAGSGLPQENITRICPTIRKPMSARVS